MPPKIDQTMTKISWILEGIFWTKFGPILGALGSPWAPFLEQKARPGQAGNTKGDPKTPRNHSFGPLEAQRHVKVPPRPPKALIFDDFGTRTGHFS